MKIPVCLLLCLLCTVANAGNGLRLSDLLQPMPTVDSSVPSPEEVLQLGVGERHWYHHEIREYLDALASASPRMVALGAHATSYGGRELVSYAISSPDNIRNLDAIRAAREEIIDPSGNPDLARAPVVMHMGYSIHGNEPSGANATPLVAYYLTAVTESSLLAQLEDVVILLNPMLNPDGLDRFAHWSNSHRGVVPSTDANDREHAEAFPGGRTNYYWFDLNRDWLAHQHPESQGRLRLFHDWKPNIQLDFHEQGSQNSYFFMPGKPERTNPLTPAINQQLTDRIADYHRRVFDTAGILYFSEESYDDFFIGKGSTYADLFGSVGILFEQPSSRGAQTDTQNGLLTFPRTISNQFRTSLSSLQAAAALRSELLTYQRDFYVDNARNSKLRGHYLATAEGDPGRLQEFVRLLRGHRIEVELLTEDFQADGHLYPANTSIAIPAQQAQSTFLRSLWNRQTEFEENVFYDVSTWTLPLAFNLQHTTDPVRKAATGPLTDAFDKPHVVELQESAVGYLIDWRDSRSPALLYALLEADANVRVATRPLTATISGGEAMAFGYGTLFVTSALEETIPAEVRDLLRAAKKTGVPVYAAASSATSSGIDLGSRDFKVLKRPQVLIATGPNVGSYNAGEIWHLLDQRIQMPLTMVDSNRLGTVSLGDYTHVLLTSRIRSLDQRGLDRLKDFVARGGILWAQGESTVDWLHDKELTSVTWRKTEQQKASEARKKKRADGGAGKADADKSATLPERRPFAQASDQAAFKLVRGAILGASLDITHPVGYGFVDDFLPVFRRSARFMDRAENAYSTPVLYTEEPLLSGYISDENRKLAAGSAGMIIDEQGQGAIVLVLDSPTFRAFWWGTQRLLVNTIFFGDLLEEP
jgi:hypothetical protein